MERKNWRTKLLNEYTLQDALEAMEAGFFTVINDGKYFCQFN